jgi:GNAT superfamily N-acetyltransferase
MSDISVVVYQKESLGSFINSEFFRVMESIPISIHRAISQINNPRADAHDALLLLAMNGEQMIGYLGLLPDVVMTASGQTKFAWLTCLWVHPSWRKQRITDLLIHEGERQYDGLLMGTEFVPQIKKMYERLSFNTDIIELEGIRFYINFHTYNLLKGRLRWPAPLKIVDKVGNIFVKKLKHEELEFQNEYIFSEHEFVPAAYNEIMDEYAQKNIFKRGTVELNWGLAYPWVNEGNADSRYHFTDYEHGFKNKCIHIYSPEGKLLGVMIYIARNEKMTVTYARLDTAAVNDASIYLAQLAAKLGFVSITCYHPSLSAALASINNLYIHKKIITRKYIVKPALLHILSEGTLQAGDGDCMFT